MNTNLSSLFVNQFDYSRKCCIILNGPPGVGKDTLADYIAANWNFTKFEFKETLIDVTCRFFSISREDWDNHYTREGKEEPWGRLTVGMNVYSQRKALQFVSEHVIKPAIGKGTFGVASFDKIKDVKFTISADGGFNEELYVFDQQFNIGELIVVRLHRDGYTFENDTRNYLYGYHSIDIDIIPDEIEQTASRIIRDISNLRKALL